jgi:hypothetical protein
MVKELMWYWEWADEGSHDSLDTATHTVQLDFPVHGITILQLSSSLVSLIHYLYDSITS